MSMQTKLALGMFSASVILLHAQDVPGGVNKKVLDRAIGEMSKKESQFKPTAPRRKLIKATDAPSVSNPVQGRCAIRLTEINPPAEDGVITKIKPLKQGEPMPE